jgi:uncharacterized protein (DUF58 family)
LKPRLRLRDPRYAWALLALLAAAYGLGHWVPRAALFLWTGLGLVDLGWAYLTVRHLDARYEAGGGPHWAGRGLVARLSLHYRGWLPPSPVVVREGPGSRLPFVRSPQGEVLAVRRGAPDPPLARRLQARRGRHRLGPLEVRATGPFGLGEAVASVESRREVVVLPRLWPLPAWPAEPWRPEGPGARRGPRSADAAVVAGVRPLLPGDPLRRIHWRRSARTGAWQVMEFEPAAGGSAVVFLDLAAAAYPGPGGPDLCDAAVELAAAVAHAALARGEGVTLHATGASPLHLSLRAGAAAARALLLPLAELRPDGPRPLAACLSGALASLGAAPTHLVAVTPAPPEAWGPALAACRRRGTRLSAVLVLGADGGQAAGQTAVAALRRLGVAAWAAAGAPDLARQLVGEGA